MATSEDKRLSDLELATGSKEETKITVNWGDPGMVLDHDTGEYITEAAWRKRHPDDHLLVVGWEDFDEK